ncbi:MAG: 3-isopropylmalate dehydrogenase [candidate division NC10 bacterium]|nr:3-isopropylmalate dehydrogenase [candidate division NC10 bacterium]
MYKVAVLPGDGVGREVMPEAIKVLEVVAARFGHRFECQEALVGGAAIDAKGVPLPEETAQLCENSDAVLFGAIGGPKWDSLDYSLRPERGILGLRQRLGLYANLRPAKLFEPLMDASPLKPDVIRGLDLILVRELLGDVYFGRPRGVESVPGGKRGTNTMTYTSGEIRRIAEVAFQIARGRRRKVTSVDKANVLETSELWREVVNEVGKGYPEVTLEHLYVDNCAMQLIRNPRQFDVMVTANLFGDILSDEAAMLTGSIGMLPSASLGGKVALYEPIHGSAPDIAGKGRANPIAIILSAAMMLEHSFALKREAEEIERAVVSVLKEGYRTQDIHQEGAQVVGTKEMGDLIAERLRKGSGRWE